MRVILSALLAAIVAPPVVAAPNILVIMTDDQTFAQLDQMPRTQSLLADQGVTFTNAFTDFPLCGPARASFLTGQRSANHGFLSNSPNADPAVSGGHEQFKPQEPNLLPVWLQGAGYLTVSIGKYLNGYGGWDDSTPEAKLHVPPGWTEWYATPQTTVSNYWDYEVNENGVLSRRGCADEDYKTDYFARKAVSFIQRHRDSPEPLFMWIQPYAPHAGTPGECPDIVASIGPEPAPRHAGRLGTLPIIHAESFNEEDVADKPSFMQALNALTPRQIRGMTRRQRSARRALLSVDQLIGKVAAALQRTGRINDTLFVLTSDQGFFLGEHRLLTTKQLPYETAVHIPLIMRGPGLVAGSTRTELVGGIDLAATIADAADATPTIVLDGRSLLELASGTDPPWRTAVQMQGLAPAETRITYRALRTTRFKYILYSNGEEELYDLSLDPDELENRVADPAYDSAQAELAAMLSTSENCAGEECWITTPEPAGP